MTGGSSDDSRSEPTGTPELGNTALSPEVASVNKDLELLRLRVLASRKRKLKEEGEVSDSEEPLPSQGQDAPSELPSLPFPSRPRSLSRESGSFRGRPAFVGRKRKCAGGMTTMVAGGGGDPSAKLFQSLEMEARQFSDSFHPQSCTVVLDDEEQHGEEGRPAGDDQCYEDETVSDDVRLKDAIEPSPLINELRQREIARQKELLSTTRTQMALIDEDLTVLTRQLEETEKVTRVAVEKQQRLKAQLRETKALIHRSKHLKMQNLTRQSALRMERGQKVKLISVLQGSILAKLQESAAAMAMTATCASPAAPVAISTPSLFAETGGSSDRRELKIFTDATSSSSSEEEASAAIDSKAMVATVGLPSRSTEINQLERKALSIQRDLIAAQISLLRTRQAQQQRSRRQQQRDKVKLTKKTIARRAKQSRALGKVMAVTPIQAPSKSSVMEAEDPSTTTSSDLGSYFPPFLHHLGGSLLEASTLGDLIQSLSEMILINCQEKEEEEEEEEGGPNLPSNIDEATGTLDSPQVTQSLYDSISEGNNLSIEEGEILGYVPYLSPLRIFSSYRFSPCFSAFAAPKQGLLSGTFTNRINPFAIICQTELEGSRCTRRNCPGQHFRSILLSDADVLEDFMRTLLAIPIQPGSPYRDHVEVTTAVKQRLLTMTDKRVPLISLVGVLLDVCKRMTDGGEHVISFVATPQAGPEGNKLTEVTSLTAVHRITNEVSNVGTAEVVPMATQTGGGPPLRHLIMGVADHRRRWGGNGDSVGSRYFPPSYPSDELVGEGTDERRDVREQKGGEGGKTWNEGEREEEGKGEVSVLGVFIKTLSLPSTSWEESMIVLREGLARYPRSTLLTAVTADVGKAGQTLDTSCLSLVRALDRYRSGATELGDLLAEVETMELPAASVVDLCYGLVKVLCDSGKAQQAINLLERLTRPGRGLAGEEFPTTIEAIVECPFSTVDRAYLILLYFYLVETDGSYPQRSFLGHPFDMVRRLDFYFLVPWSSPNETFLNILEETLLGLLREHDKPVSPPVAEWLFVNYLRLAEWHSKFQIKPELLQDIGSHPNLSLHLIDPRSASPDSLTHSMDLFTILQGTTLGVLRLALASAENPTLVNDILRSFWSDYFAEIMDDASLVASIASHLGCSELFPMALTVMRARRNLKSDVFFWLLAILSLVRLSTLMRTDIVGQLLEMGIAQIGEASPCILLLALLARLGEAADGRSGLLVGTTIRSRFTSVANSDRHRPKSQVEGIWASYAWQKHVAPPQDEFIELNIPSVRRGLALMSSLIHPYMVVD